MAPTINFDFKKLKKVDAYIGSLKLCNYSLGNNLGCGKFGVVKIGQHLLTKHFVAVKIINRRKIKGMEIVDKIRREITILCHLHHPHIVKL
ncbi:hypothetical protein HZS_4306 [Henneguya salminicola]|nr:hypothetical protein HZS_4306 [Henneguya salminicola]